MKKGRIININQLPKISIEEDTKKIKIVELAGISIPNLNNFNSDLSVHFVLRKYLYEPINYQLAKGINKAKIWLPTQNKNLNEILLQTGVAAPEKMQQKEQTLFSTEQLLSLKQIKPSSKPLIINGVNNIESIKKSKIFKVGTYNLISINQNIIISKENFYVSASLKNIQIEYSDIEKQSYEEFIKNHRFIEITSFKFLYDITSKTHVLKIACNKQFQLSLIQDGLGKLSIQGQIQLQKEVYDKAKQLEEQAKKSYKGFWKNYLDIFSLIYVKNNFLAKVIEVIEGHVYRLKNMVTNKIIIIELSTVFCPIGQQLGAFEARQFARKQIIGKLVNVYIKKQTAYLIQAALVRLIDHQPLDKILLSSGWGSIKQDSKNQSQSTRLQQLLNKASESKLGLFSSSKNKVGIVRFEQLTTLNTKQTIRRVKQFAQGLFTSKHVVSNYDNKFKGVIEGFKNNDTFKIRLKKAIVNVKIQGIKDLNSKLVIKQYKSFKDNSIIFLQQNFLQRDVEVRMIQFSQKHEGFIGEIQIQQTNVAQVLLEQGLVYVDDSWYVQNAFHQKQESAKTLEKGVWNPLLLQLRKKETDEQNFQTFSKVTISQIKSGNIIFYQTQQSKIKLQTIVSPALKSLKQTKIPLAKQDTKIGNICAAPFEGDLYRVKIISFKKKNPNLVQVLYIDYGNTAEIDKVELLSISEQLMIIQQLAHQGQLLFLKKIKDSNDSYESIFDQIQATLLEREFDAQIIYEQIVLFDPKVKHSYDILKSVNNDILQQGLLKLDKKSLSGMDDIVIKQLIQRQNDARNLKLGIWMSYQSESQYEDDINIHIKSQKLSHLASPKKKKNPNKQQTVINVAPQN